MAPNKIFAFLFLFFLGCTPKVDEVVGPGGPAGPTTTVFQIPAAGINPLENNKHLDVLLNEIGNAGFVLLGESSYGTAEFYTWRDAITRRLIEEKGFKLLAIEGDWPAAYAVNRYIKGDQSLQSSKQALEAFDRWPAWMWANQEFAGFIDWLRNYNGQQAPNQQVGFYGLDVYSLWESVESLKKDFPEADALTLAAIDQALTCLGPYNRNTLAYAQATKGGGGCAEELNRLLAAVQRQIKEHPGESAFNAGQNATIGVNAHKYYQSTVVSNLQSWNIREHHMIETLDRLLNQYGPNAKIVVWAHNIHVGDARFTSMAEEGMENLGQLVREKYKNKGVYLVGLASFQGTVLASTLWGGPVVTMAVPAAQPGSWEALLHEQGAVNKLVVLREWRKYTEVTRKRGHRSIGLVYDPNQETGNFVPTNLPQRYDAFLYLDKTQALRPLSDYAGTLRMPAAGPQ